jgi:hypothetical protein
MANEGKPVDREAAVTPGLAKGPGPTPPGVDDGTVKPAPEGTFAPPLGAEEQERHGEAAERSAGTRQADLEQAVRRAEPEEPDPS